MDTGAAIAKAWQDFAKTRCIEAKDLLITHYAPMIKYIVGRLKIHIGSHADHEDLISYGIFGLIDAIDKFDPDKGVKFETYASLRIRGAIIDSLRAMDWVPRSYRQRSKMLETAYLELEADLSRDPTEDELAEKLGISPDDVRELMQRSALMSVVSLNEYLEINNDSALADMNEEQNPEGALDRKQMKEMLVDAIENLKDNERLVVTLYYFEELTLKEISKILGVTESRISQIHSRAVMRLRARLGAAK
ncbi:MAG: FliA/WhiG family RNA polymerase sigma factor [Defluviitaleaceae bacterium]|nr:FliA/WhiG family RNA polymerase sigma factor [Defluviitaleaceae bacterium]